MRVKLFNMHGIY